MTVTVLEQSGFFRVIEADGEPAMSGRNPSDNGGTRNYGVAVSLAAEINRRRERKESDAA